jgi:hypothetical protein
LKHDGTTCTRTGRVVYDRQQHYMMWRDVYRIIISLPIYFDLDASYHIREAAYMVMAMYGMMRQVGSLDPNYMYRIESIMYPESRLNTPFWKKVHGIGFDQVVMNAVSAGFSPLMWAFDLIRGELPLTMREEVPEMRDLIKEAK